MNRKCFRLVFNRHRGVLMPVAAIVVAMSGFGGSPGASAQVRAHPDAAPHQRPTVLRTGNGVPLVNFHAPSPSGVALSVLSQFDVDRPGVILNNSLYGAQTRLGGAVAANPWLDKAPARIIVNEVRSTRPSSLRGDIEVAGQRAQVVVANPAGIECDGCGFINASRATMTTGVPQFSEGALQGYKVTDGVVRIGAGGLDATAAELTDLIARGVEVRGRVLARSLQVVAGPGTVSMGTEGALVPASTAPGSGEAPSRAIDISALGGLYAGSIRLWATEAGVGVRNAGAIGAGVGSVVVTAAGQLENAGSIVALEEVRLTVAGLDSPGLLASGVDDENRATRPAMLAVQSSDDVRIAGRALAGGDIDLRAKDLDLSGGRIATPGRIDLQAGGKLDNAGGAVIAGAGLTARVGQALRNEDGILEVQGAQADLHLAAASVDNRDGRIVNLGAGELRIDAGQALRNGDARGLEGMGLIGANGDLALAADGIVNGDGGRIVAGQALGLSALVLDNSGGSLQAQGDLVIDEANLAVRNVAGLISAGRALRLTLASLDNRDGRIANAAKSQGDVRLALGGALDNTRGRIGADRDVSVQASELVGVGEIVAGRDLALALDAGYTHSEGHLLSSERDLSLRLGGDFVNPAWGHLPKAGDEPLAFAAVRDLRVEAANIANSGDLVAGGALTLKARRIDNSGSIVGDSVFAQAAEELRNEGPAALIGAADEGGLLELLAPRIVNRDPLTATDSMPTTTVLGMGDVVIAGGTDAQGRYVRAQSVLNESGRIVAGGDLLVAADTLTNQRRVLQASSTHDVPMPGESGSVVYTPENPDVPGGRYIEPDHGGEWNADYIRTDYTATVARNRLEALSPKSQIEAGGNFRPEVSTLQNYWSAITAAGSVPLNGVTVDSDGWRGATPYSEQRHYSGVYVYRRYKGDYFTKGPWEDPPQVTQLGGYDASLTAGGSIAGAGNTLLNVSGTTPHTPLGMQAGQPVEGRQQGTGADLYDQLTLPQGGLYRVSPSPDSRYLVESNAAFTRGRSWTSSDAYFREMGQDPSQVGKRLGDGFYEQQLVRSQLIALTGRAVLEAVDAQAQFAALLSAGAQVARALQLAPGAGLSAEQVAALTGDVIVMEARVIQGQSVLVPVVYLASASRQQLLPKGSLIAARDVVLTDTQDFRNSGVIRAGNTLVIDGARIDNRGGRLESGGLLALSTRQGGDIDLTSAQVKAGSLDIDSGGTLVLATDAQQREGTVAGGSRSITRLGQAGRIDVQGDGSLVTAGDLLQSGASIAVGGDLQAEVGGSWRMDNLETREVQQVRHAGGHSDTQVVGQVGSRLEVGGTTQAHVAQDLVAQGATLDLRGGGRIEAGRDVILEAAVRSERVDSSSRSGRHSETHQLLDEQLVGTRIDSGADLAIVAGGDVNLRAAAVQVDKGQASLQAGRDVNVESAEERHASHDTHVSRQRGVLSSRTISTDDRIDFTVARGSSISADGLEVGVGRDLRVQGSQLVATGDVLLRGGRDVAVEAATEVRDESHARSERRSGLFTSGGVSVTLGSRMESQKQGANQSTAQASTIGSVAGDVLIEVARAYRQAGSDVIAPQGDVTIDASKADIVEARETYRQSAEQKFEQSGLTFSATSTVLSAMQSVQRQVQAVGKTRNSRMQALGVANAATMAKQATDAVKVGQGDENGMVQTGKLDADGAPEMKKANAADQAGGIQVSLSLGTSKSQSHQSSQSDTARASTVVANGTTTIKATGDGAGSDLTIQASNVRGKTVVLEADGSVDLLAARNTNRLTSDSSNSSASLGIAAQLGNAGVGVGFTASAAKGSASGRGDETVYSNTHVAAAESVSLRSGESTTLHGATVEGRQVSATVGGDLNIESLQDTSTYTERDRQAGASAMFGAGAGGGVNILKSSIASDYASVTEQSAIKAGDGGFTVTVGGSTDLRGGAITSTQDAVDSNRNSFQTGGNLTTSDIQNHASYEASSATVGLGMGAASLPGSGLGKDSGSTGSTTTAGISGRAGDVAKRTGDNAQGVGKIFDAEKVRQEIQAQATITQEFGKQASNAIARHSASQRQALRDQIAKASDAEKAALEKQLDEVNKEERVLNILVGAVTGMGMSTLTKEGLAAAADQMRSLMIEDSRKFAGVVDFTGRVLSNASGVSEGVKGDGFKLGGTRLDLDRLCGPANERCATNFDGSLATNAKGQIQFIANDAHGNPLSLEDFLAGPDGQKMAGATGGVQGAEGSLFKGTFLGSTYQAGSWQDKLIEAFAGTHDFVGGKLSGLYDDQGSAARGRSGLTSGAQEVWSASGAIVLSAPFAAAQGLPPEVWKAISIFVGAAK